MTYELNELRYIAVVDESIPTQIISLYPEHQLHLLPCITRNKFSFGEKTSVSIISFYAV